jgi:transglutaminase-like putative cysteine protease
MQRFQIIHRTYYHFSNPVILGQHSFRIYPRESRECRVESFSLLLDPQLPLRWQKDVEDNSIGIANLALTTQSLSIESDAIIQQYSDNPFDFILEEYAFIYPQTGVFIYTMTDGNLLEPYRVLPLKITCDLLSNWIATVWTQDEIIQTYVLLERLCRAIYNTFTYTIRDEPGVQSVSDTLRLTSGSCRDFSLMLIEAARCLGFAARFVSGYLHSPPNAQNFGATHAWVEVYLPGAGWKGFDPTLGALASADNIAVAVSAYPDSIPPIEGLFSGDAVSTMDVGVWVTRLS